MLRLVGGVRLAQVHARPLLNRCADIVWIIFIVASALLGVLQWFVLPETRLVPLEQIAGCVMLVASSDDFDC